MTAGAPIVLDDVVRHHDTPAGVVRALDGVTLEIAGGTSTAVTGRSGCGKSTLLGLVGGLDAPTSGRVAVGDETLSGRTERDRTQWRRANVGFVFQTDDLLPHLTALENVLHQLALTGHGGEAGVERARALLDDLDVATETDKLPDQMSGGQRQRVAVARALVHEPPLLLADEPTGAVDRVHADAILDLLLAAQARTGATLVVVTHDPRVSSRLDRRILMTDGRVVADSATVEAAEPAG
jgi:ABC-type lipoprotein export system ATPase subunit